MRTRMVLYAMAEIFWYVLPINPEPWAVGPLGIGKKNGKFFPYMGPNPTLKAYKEAVQEELKAQEAQMLPKGEYRIACYFWRRLDTYHTASGREASMHQADGTNMLKATEDAVQGILFDNDRNVRSGTWAIMEEQTMMTTPTLIIAVSEYVYIPPLFPTAIAQKLAMISAVLPEVSDNVWTGPPDK